MVLLGDRGYFSKELPCFLLPSIVVGLTFGNSHSMNSPNKEASLIDHFNRAQSILHHEFGIIVLYNHVQDFLVNNGASAASIATKLLNEVKHKVTLLGIISNIEEVDDVHTT
jgi:hypothetical protein